MKDWNGTDSTGPAALEKKSQSKNKTCQHSADALSDTEVLYPILHPVIVCSRAGPKSLWMGFNWSFFSLMVTWWKKIKLWPLQEVQRVLGSQTNPDMVSDLRVLSVQLGSLLWYLQWTPVYVCLTRPLVTCHKHTSRLKKPEEACIKCHHTAVY